MKIWASFENAVLELMPTFLCGFPYISLRYEILQI